MFDIVEDPIDLQTLYDRVRDDAFGAVLVFVGVVRERSDDDRAVSGLSYEVYERLAIEEMQRIAEEVRLRWSPCRVAMTHRTGSLSIGEPSVAVGVATAHRAEAFNACHYAIDELKRRVPIWKKEHYLEGDSQWRENCAHTEELR